MTTLGFGRDRFERSLRQVRPRLLTVGMQLLANGYDAEDAVQDTALKLWGVRQRIADEAHFVRLAQSVLRHVCLNILRQRALHATATLAEDAEPLAFETPHTLLVERERARCVERAWSELPQHYRLLLQMREVDRLSTPEIAALLCTSEANVRQRLSRARKAMLAQIARQAGAQ